MKTRWTRNVPRTATQRRRLRHNSIQLQLRKVDTTVIISNPCDGIDANSLHLLESLVLSCGLVHVPATCLAASNFARVYMFWHMRNVTIVVTIFLVLAQCHMEPCLRPATLSPYARASETTLYSKYKECGQQKCRFGAREGCTTVRVAERLIFGASGQRIGFKSRDFLFACRPCAGNSLFCFLSPV